VGEDDPRGGRSPEAPVKADLPGRRRAPPEPRSRTETRRPRARADADRRRHSAVIACDESGSGSAQAGGQPSVNSCKQRAGAPAASMSQFQPRCRSATLIAGADLAAERTRGPRAPATIASNAMKTRPAANVGKDEADAAGSSRSRRSAASTRFALLRLGTRRRSASCRRPRLMSVLTGGPPACRPGGFDTGVDVDAVDCRKPPRYGWMAAAGQRRCSRPPRGERRPLAEPRSARPDDPGRAT